MITTPKYQGIYAIRSRRAASNRAPEGRSLVHSLVQLPVHSLVWSLVQSPMNPAVSNRPDPRRSRAECNRCNRADTSPWRGEVT